ncbi:MAG: hypothetical protein H7Z72_07135 [Bacteroidetes bacterium]|nr:hypothetical protein [Fibrella sp.]
MTRDIIINAIMASFSTTNIPAAHDVVIGSSGEAITTKSIFIGKAWTNLNPDELIVENSALGYLSDAAFRYYLPAYMMLLLDDIQRADMVASSVVHQLTLPLEVDQLRLMNFLAQSTYTQQDLGQFLLDELRNSTANVAFFIRRTALFTPQQGHCINMFLIGLSEFYPDYYDQGEPLMASQRYWFKYKL